MPRILCVDIPNDKPTHISLRYIYGIGPSLALRLCEQANVNAQRKAKELSDEEMADIKHCARRARVTVCEWVRRELREAYVRRPVKSAELKLEAVRKAAQYSFPTADIDQMLREIEQGYQS